MILASMSNQGSIYHWTRDHRVHHKHSDTDADPHNINRGFFFSHIGWLLLKKHSQVKKAGNEINCQDLLDDWIVKLIGLRADTHMEELKTLLGMDLPDEAKSLLEKVNTAYTEKSEAVTNFMTTIESKTNAIAEITEQRAKLKEQLAEAKAGNGGNKDNGNEQIEKNNAEWQAKYGELEQQYNGIKYTNDETDARYLAHLLRLGILPTGYIYQYQQRTTGSGLSLCIILAINYSTDTCIM